MHSYVNALCIYLCQLFISMGTTQAISMKQAILFPGRIKVSFKRGPSGHLRRDPSEEARRIKDNPSLQDKSTPQREDVVRNNARSVVLQRGGDVSDKQEVLGEYILQFGKYKGKSFRWLLENDIGYTLYLSSKVEEEERAGQFNPEGPCKDSLLSFLEYSRSFKEIEDLRRYLSERPDPVPVLSEDDNVVGFGARAQDTWRKIWNTRADGYAAFIMGKSCVPGSKMYRLQQYLLKQQRQVTTAPSATPSPSPSTPSAPSTSCLSSDHPVMEEDEELEKMMLSLSPPKCPTQQRSPTATACPVFSAAGGYFPHQFWRLILLPTVFSSITVFNTFVYCFGSVLACSKNCILLFY
ncbi:uncharacterized protein LOC117597045 [Pangasianodon hypophthalmus]|uniref:uncharacterized protein LOC117597045 n=1 Tax=Pangasianodon hypophthalmus TaxID=310915 RepID=UPI002307EE24|nr:uncharacterized protein LOC117597045 [Pangasianodon hypophthalmus]